jgi:hypothetical protein
MLVQYSALFIITPALIALFLGRWPDVAIITAQATSSIWYHSSHSPISLVVDRLSLSALVVRTLLLAITSYETIGLFIFGFGYMITIYTYGFYTHRFSFDPRPEVADMYHASIHILGIAIYSGSMIFFL